MAGKLMPLPERGDVFFDMRDPDRTCRISWHPDKQAFVLSLWQSATCKATFQLDQADVPAMINMFVQQLVQPLREEREAG
jgi:hypothetical protein